MSRNQLRLYLWLSESKTRKMLTGALRVLVIIALLWTGVVAYGLVQIRESIAKQRDETEQVKTKADALDAQVRLQRKAADRRQQIEIGKDISDTSRIADFINTMSASSDVSVRGVRFGGSRGNDAKQNTTSNNRQQSNDSFECELTGKFPALLKVMDSLAMSPLAIEISSVQISRTQVDPRTQEANLLVHLSGKLQK